MMRKIIFPILLGLAGCAVLISLGIWQMQRLQWKTAIIDEIDRRMVAAPVALPATPAEDVDKYLPVALSGTLTGDPLFVLVSLGGRGPGYRYVQALDTDGRKVLVDLGWVPLEQLGQQPDGVRGLAVTGNLHWPDDKDSWTPEPDPAGIWFARNVPDMSAALGTESVMVIARDYTVTGTDQAAGSRPFIPMPVDSGAIKNDHLSYAVTWFGLALVWALMSLFLIKFTRQEDA